ncbi:hypothetical protein RJG79_10855 [Mycoplasmatota bacterium WC44]
MTILKENKPQIVLKAGSDAKAAKWFEVERRITQVNKVITDDGFVREKFIDILLIKQDIKIVSKNKRNYNC